MNSDEAPKIEPSQGEVFPKAVRPYTPPRLEVLGELRDLTFGPSPGVGDSTLPANRKVAGT